MKKLLALTLSLILLFSTCALAETDTNNFTFTPVIMGDELFESLFDYSSDNSCALYAALSMVEYGVPYPNSEIDWSKTVYITDTFIILFADADSYVLLYYSYGNDEYNGSRLDGLTSSALASSLLSSLDDCSYKEISLTDLGSAMKDINSVINSDD